MTGKKEKSLQKRSEGGTSSSSEIAQFIKSAGAVARPGPVTGRQRGRLIFALDATMSRQPTWDAACSVQAQMFDAVADTGGLDVQLLYFRGFGECKASKWVSNANALSEVMTRIDCRGGHTQISKVLAHARSEYQKQKVSTLIYVGDAMEEDADRLCQKAGELGLLGCKMFVFQEGRDRQVEAVFREFARLTKGAYARFDASAPRELADLLRAAAAYATGGTNALRLQKTGQAKVLLEQLD